jgi:lipopolysaccharide/colanic/teichoic acid biosynthesis glycosyltransferase
MVDWSTAARIMAAAAWAGPVAALRRRGPATLVALDLVMFALAVGANQIAARESGFGAGPAGWIVLYGALMFATIAIRRGDRSRPVMALVEGVDLVLAGAVAALLVLTAREIVHPDAEAVFQVVRLWAFSTAYLVGGRFAGAVAARRAPDTRPQTMIVGAGEVGAGFVAAASLADRRGESRALPQLRVSTGLQQVDRPRRDEHLTVEVVTPTLAEQSHSIALEPLVATELTSKRRADVNGWQFEVKYVLDRIVGALLLILLVPLLLVIAVATKLSSPGPVLFRQPRVGLDARVFDILKFRTMRHADSGTESDAEWIARELGLDHVAAAYTEDRRTPLGRLLRRTSLDELPQLLNIVRGDMSLVGPRPERVQFAMSFGQHVHGYSDRHRVKSGLTGWAQVNGLRGQTSLRDRIEWDNYYIENWSPWLDLKILLRTPAAVWSHQDS